MAYQSGGAGGKGSLVEIAAQVIGAGGGTFSLTGIPANYSALRLVLYGRGAAATSAWAKFRFNGDSGTKYGFSNQFFQGAGGGVGGINATSFDGLFLIGATDPASCVSSCDLLIPGYADTTWFKTVTGTATDGDTSAPLCATIAAVWADTSAINRIDSLDTYDQFSKVVLYGVV